MEMEFEEPVYEAPPAQKKQTKLTSDNLSQLSDSKSKTAKAKKSKKGGAKPAWAVTEKQLEENKDAEIDDLIDFAYDLDYEKYMEDYEFR